jgi:hypothetical protein
MASTVFLSKAASFPSDVGVILRLIEKVRSVDIKAQCEIEARTECYFRGVPYREFRAVTTRGNLRVVAIVGDNIILRCEPHTRSTEARQKAYPKDWKFWSYIYHPDCSNCETLARCVAEAPNGNRHLSGEISNKALAELHAIIGGTAFSRGAGA